MWMARAYWIAVALAAAVATHAAFVLFVPAYWFSQQVHQIAGSNGQNSFFILPPEDQARLFPGLPHNGVTGVCVFDVSKGDVTLSADLPDGFWVTTIYTDRGESIYSVNNRQSGANIFNVTLSLAPGFIDMLIQATDKERPEIDSGWTVMSPRPVGLAVVWYPLPDMALRAVTGDGIARTRCAQGIASPSQ